MLVKSLLKKKQRSVITAAPETTLAEAMELLISNKIGCLPILDQGKLVGIISDKDIFCKVHETSGNYHRFRVCDVMTTDLVVGLLSDELTYIAGVMDKAQIRHVPIVEAGRLIGLVSQRDIIKWQAKDHEVQNRYLNLYMNSLGSRDLSGSY